MSVRHICTLSTWIHRQYTNVSYHYWMAQGFYTAYNWNKLYCKGPIVNRPIRMQHLKYRCYSRHIHLRNALYFYAFSYSYAHIISDVYSPSPYNNDCVHKICSVNSSSVECRICVLCWFISSEINISKNTNWVEIFVCVVLQPLWVAKEPI